MHTRQCLGDIASDIKSQRNPCCQCKCSKSVSVPPHCGRLSNLNSNSILSTRLGPSTLLAPTSVWNWIWSPFAQSHHHTCPYNMVRGLILKDEVVKVMILFCNWYRFCFVIVIVLFCYWATSVCNSSVTHASFPQAHHHTCEIIWNYIILHVILSDVGVVTL